MPKVIAPRMVPIDAAIAAGKKRPADDRHGDRLQLHAFAAQRVDRREARHLDDAGDRGEAEAIMNRMIVTRSTGTPRLRAACTFWPRAWTQFPNRVRESRKVPSAPMTRNQSIDMRKPPSSGPAIDGLERRRDATVIGKPPVSAIRTPRQISIVPSVTTKEWMRNLTTSAPLTAPRTAPTATAAGWRRSAAGRNRASARRRHRR